MVGRPRPDAAKVRALREALPAVGAGLFLNAPVAGPLPAEAAAAMAEIAGWELRTGRAHRDRPAEVAGRLDEARAAAAAVLAADLDDVVLAHGQEDALARAVRTVDWRPGDRAVVVVDPALRALDDAVPAGVEIVRVGSPAEAVGVSGARLVALPLVRSATGERLAVEAAASAARSAGATVLVEASLAVGAVQVDRERLGADLLVARAECWLLGPEGLAIVAGRGLRQPTLGFHQPSLAAFARGCGWLSMYVGLPWAFERGARLTADASARLGAIEGVTVRTPPERATTLAFSIAGWGAEAALEELGSRIFLLASAVPAPDAIRIGIGFWTTEDELERLASGVTLLARHTPRTLPARPRLTVLGGRP